MLAIRVDGQLGLFEEGHFLDTPWKLSECDNSLTEAEFPSDSSIESHGEIDVTDEGRLEVHFVERVRRQLRLLAVEPGGTRPVWQTGWTGRFPTPTLSEPNRACSFIVC